MSGSSQWYLSFWSSHENPKYIPLSSHACYMHCKSTLLFIINNIIAIALRPFVGP
jgi:hypothetical protein